MEYNTNSFSRSFDPMSYLYLAKAVNTFNLSRGYDSLHEAVLRIKAQLHLISFRGDHLFFPSEMAHIAKMMTRNAQPHTYQEIESEYGHDAFLVEIDKFESMISEALA